MHKKAQQIKAHQLATGASSSTIVDVERSTTEGA